MYILDFTIHPIYFLATLALIGIVLQTLYLAVRAAIFTTKALHQIPCAKCQFCTGNYYLKCTVHPSYALTERAINCRDFCLLQKQ